MAENSQRPKGQDDVPSSLNTAINSLNLAKDVSSVASAKAAFDSTGILLTIIRVSLPPIHSDRPLNDVSRTQWLVKWITSNLVWPAPTPVKPLTGKSTEDEWTSPVSPSLVRLSN